MVYCYCVQSLCYSECVEYEINVKAQCRHVHDFLLFSLQFTSKLDIEEKQRFKAHIKHMSHFDILCVYEMAYIW